MRSELKILAVAIVMVLAAAAVAMTDDAEEDDAATTYQVIVEQISSIYSGCTVDISATGYTTVTASTSAPASLTVASGTSVTLTASAGSGFTFSSFDRLTTSGTSVSYVTESSSSPYTFTVTENRDYQATFTASTTYLFEISVDASYTGCSVDIELNGASYDTVTAGNYVTVTIPSGTTVALTSNPASNYSFSYWSDGSSSVSSSDPYSFSITARTVLYAIFVQTGATFTVTASSASDTNMTLTASTSVSWETYATHGGIGVSTTRTSTTLLFTPVGGAGYVTFRATSSADSTTFDVTIYVCCITYDANGGSGAPGTQYYIQSDQSFSQLHTFTLDSTTIPTYSGYTFGGWAQTSTSTYALTQYTAAYTASYPVYAIWTANPTYTVSTSVGQNGSVSPTSVTVESGVSYLASGDTMYFSDGQTIVATPDSGYSTVWSPSSNTVSSAETITVSFTATTTYTVIVEQISSIYSGCTVDISATGYTTVTASTSAPASLTVASGTSVTLTASAGSGFTFSSFDRLTTSGTSVSYVTESSSSPYTFTVTENRDYQATFTASTTYFFKISVDASYTGCSVDIDLNGATVGTASAGGYISFTAPSGTTVTLTPDPSSNYSFSYWSDGSSSVSSSDPYSFSITARTVLYAIFVQNTGATFTVTASSASYSEMTLTADTSVTWAVSAGSADATYTTTSTTLTITPDDAGYETFIATSTSDSTTVSVTVYICSVAYDANGGSGGPDTTYYIQSEQSFTSLPTLELDTSVTPTKTNYTFVGWSTTSTSSYTITTYTVDYTTAYTVYAVYQLTNGGAYWSNDMFNGSIDMVFQWQSSNNKMHTITMDLYEGTVSGQVTTWSASGYSLEISQVYSSGASITATLYYNGTVVSGMSSTVSLGTWTTYQLTIDAQNGIIYAMPVNTFNSFIDYTVYSSQQKTILDYSSVITNETLYVIVHEDSTGTNAVQFSVSSTSVFLETYGSVLYNPSINVYDYFPQYSSVRLNFYSFALYGESVTVNNTTYTVTDSKVTVSYADSGGDHYLPSLLPNAAVKTKTMTLTNIYVTWDGDTGHCSLTFVNDRFTIDLGTYTAGSETVSFTGMWYFATQLYEPYTATESQLGGWKALPDLDASQMLLIFIGAVILIGAVFMAYKRSVGPIDLIIMGGCIAVGFILLELFG